MPNDAPSWTEQDERTEDRFRRFVGPHATEVFVRCQPRSGGPDDLLTQLKVIFRVLSAVEYSFTGTDTRPKDTVAVAM